MFFLILQINKSDEALQYILRAHTTPSHILFEIMLELPINHARFRFFAIIYSAAAFSVYKRLHLKTFKYEFSIPSQTYVIKVQ
jgi:hypothetical protein